MYVRDPSSGRNQLDRGEMASTRVGERAAGVGIKENDRVTAEKKRKKGHAEGLAFRPGSN